MNEREQNLYGASFLDQMHRYSLLAFHARGKLARMNIDPSEVQREFSAFSQQDLWEIYFFYAHAIRATMRSFTTFLEAEGVAIQSKTA
jgi:hypothetical protein